MSISNIPKHLCIKKLLYSSIKSIIYQVSKNTHTYVLKIQKLKYFHREITNYNKLKDLDLFVPIVEYWNDDENGYILFEYGGRQLTLKEFTLYSDTITFLLLKLHQIGYYHNDFHIKNILYHETKDRIYFIDMERIDKNYEISDFDTLVISSSGRYRPPLSFINTEKGLYYYKLFVNKMPFDLDETKLENLIMITRTCNNVEQIESVLKRNETHKKLHIVLIQLLHYIDDNNINDFVFQWIKNNPTIYKNCWIEIYNNLFSYYGLIISLMDLNLKLCEDNRMIIEKIKMRLCRENNFIELCNEIENRM